jgi:hypothetical protein
MTVRRTGSPKREVGPTHLAHDIHNRDNSLNSVKDSSTAPRKNGSEHRHHHHHEHSSPESELSCGRCMRKTRKRDERATVEVGKPELVERLKRSERGVPEGESRRTSELLATIHMKETKEAYQRRKMDIAAARNTSRRSRSLARPDSSPWHTQHPNSARDTRDMRTNGIEMLTQRGDIERARAAARAVGHVEIVSTRQVLPRERAPVRQVEIIPTRRPAVSERASAPQVEMVPARRTERTYVRQAERTAQRYVERPQPQPPPNAVERLGRVVERTPPRPVPRLQPRGRSQPAQSTTVRQPEKSTVSQRQSTRVQPMPPQVQPAKPILGFELEDKPEKLYVIYLRCQANC